MGGASGQSSPAVSRWGPRVELAPLVGSHDVQPYRLRPRLASLAFQVLVKPGESLAQDLRHHTQRAVRIWPDSEVGCLARVAEGLVVIQKLTQEEVVPAREQVHGGFNLVYPPAVVPVPPVGVVGFRVCEPVAEKGLCIARDLRVRFADGQVHKAAPDPAPNPELQEQALEPRGSRIVVLLLDED